MKNTVYIIGIDGSGKTTLSLNLIKRFKKDNLSASYLYARYTPILSLPLKFLSKIFLYKENTEFQNYKKYSEIKTEYSNRHKALSRIYALICIMDYILFTWPKVMYKYLFSNYIIIDRYIGDLVVTISIATNLSKSDMIFILNILHKLFPIPVTTFFINMNEEIAFKRKNDIQSVKYLKERQKKYLILQKYYNFKILDGSKSREALLEDTYDMIPNKAI